MCARHQQGSMRLPQPLLPLIVGQLAQLLRLVIAKPAEQLIRSRELCQLLDRQGSDEIRHFVVHLETKERSGAIFADHALRKQQVGQVDILDIIQKAIGFHINPCVRRYCGEGGFYGLSSMSQFFAFFG